MSQRRDQVEERLDEYESQLDSVYRLYHIPVLAAVMLFMLWIRVRHYERSAVLGYHPLVVPHPNPQHEEHHRRENGDVVQPVNGVEL